MPLELAKGLFPAANDPTQATADMLVAESNHRIANSLQLVAGLVRRNAKRILERHLSAAEIPIFLQELATRVETIARLHRALSEDHATMVALGSYLRDIMTSVVDALAWETKIQFSHQCDDTIRVAPSHALSLGLIVNEMVTNAVKYAHPAAITGKIDLKCYRSTTRKLVVKVIDDGVGLPETFDAMTDGGTGMQLIRLLATQLGAQLQFDSSPLGLTTTVIIDEAPRAL